MLFSLYAPYGSVVVCVLCWCCASQPVAVLRPHLPVFHDENETADSTSSSGPARIAKPFQSHFATSSIQQPPASHSSLHGAAHFPLIGRSHSVAGATSTLNKPSAARKMQRTALSDLSNKQPTSNTATAAGRPDKDELAKKRAAVTARAHHILNKQPAQPATTASSSSSSSRVIRPVALGGSTSALPPSLSFSSGSLRHIVRPCLPSSASFSLPGDWSAMGMKRKAADDDGDDEEDEEEDDDEVNICIDIQRIPPQRAVAAVEQIKSHTADMLISPTAALATSLSHLATTATAVIPPSSNACRPSHAHLFVTDYASYILGHMLSSQSSMLPSPSYMSQQADLNPRMREILIDWLTEVSHKFRLQEETMLLSVSIVDRFLSVQTVGRRRLQLVGCVGMLLACKYEEMLVPEVDDFVHVSDKAYSREELIECEGTVLNALQLQAHRTRRHSASSTRSMREK